MRIVFASFALAITVGSAPAQSCLGQLTPVQPAMACSSSPVSLCLCSANGSGCHWEWACPSGSGTPSPSMNPMIPLMGTPAPTKNPSEAYADGQRAAEQLRLMREQTELLRQQTEALRQQNEAAAAALASTPSTISPPKPVAASIFTAGMLNCRGWRSFDAERRLIYTMGIMEGFQAGFMSGEIALGALENPPPAEKTLAGMEEWRGKLDLNYGKRVEAMNALCAPSENSAIQVVFATPTASMKANGYTDEQIEAKTAIIRRQANEAAK